jgi:hypothetical protein
MLQELLDANVGAHSDGDRTGLDRVLNVLESDDPGHAFHFQGGAGVYRQNAGVGVGAAQDGGVQHKGQLNVIDELPLPPQEPPVLFSPDGSANVRLGHTGTLIIKFGPI